MAENSQAEELYEVAVLLLAATKSLHRLVGGKLLKALIRRAEKALKARPQ